MAWGRESSLEAAGTLVVAAPSPGSILHHPGGAGWSWGWCGCHKDPCQTKLQFCRVPHMGGIKLQLLCGVRIELAVGSLPYPGESGFQLLVLEETGHYLDFQFVSPVWTWGKIPLGIPTFLPMEGVHSQNQKTMSSLHSFTESLFPFMIGTFTAHQNRFR